MMDDSWWPAIIVLSFLFVLLCWWLSGFTMRNARSHEAYRISVEDARRTTRHLPPECRSIGSVEPIASGTERVTA